MGNLMLSFLKIDLKAVLFCSLITLFAATQGLSQNPTSQNSGNSQTSALERYSTPGEMHKKLDVLTGEWNVEIQLYFLGGTLEKPVISNDLICRRKWVAETGNRFIEDVTEGTVNGKRYYRIGFLGYSNIDKDYEWNTVDAMNTNMMTYKKDDRKVQDNEISMSGTFTDPGLLGGKFLGKTIGQRTVIKVESPERHIIDLYFTPPGNKESLMARMTYTRRSR